MNTHQVDSQEPLPDWELLYKGLKSKRSSAIKDDTVEITGYSTQQPANDFTNNHRRDQQNHQRRSNMASRKATHSLARADSRVSRLSKRLSQTSELVYEGFEFQGWLDSTLPSAHINDGLWRLDTLDSVHQASQDTLHDNNDNSVVDAVEKPDGQAEEPKQKYGTRTWLIMFALCITQLLNAFEGTVTSTALPSIVADLDAGEEFIWVTSGYFLTSTVFQPLFGQTADIFGRKWLIIFAVAAFVLGSGISGGAPTIGVLILGRVIQGVGGGGINVIANVIVSDMFPLRDRGKFLAIVFGSVSVGTSIGPFVGGIIVERSTWRWVFYLNLPVGGISLLLLFLFLKSGTGQDKKTKKTSIKQKLRRIDYGGNVLFILGVTLILVALAYGGTKWAWTSYQTLMSLLLGLFILVIFLFYEESNYCKEPTLPLRLFRNRTSAAAYAITFLHSLLTLQILYFLPVYFQAVKLATPTLSGIDSLPTVLILVPSSVISGALLSKIGRYKPFHLVGFGLLVLALGLFTRLKHDSPTGMWVVLQLIGAAGSGLVLSTLLPAVQACLRDADTAPATAAWAFLRSFGIVWGVAVPSAIFNAQASKLVGEGLISDPSIAATLGTGGGAYEHATAEWVRSLAEGSLRNSVIKLYEKSLSIVWIFGVAVAALGFLLVFIEKEVILRQKLETATDEDGKHDCPRERTDEVMENEERPIRETEMV